MKVRSSIVWIVVFLICASMVSVAAQRNNNPRGNRGLPPEGATREDVLRIQNKARPMLEVVELLQRRTGLPISYEDPLWAYEGTKEKAGEIRRVIGFPDRSRPNAPVTDLISLAPANFEFKIPVDSRSHLMAEPIDGSLGEVLSAVIKDYGTRQLPGAYTDAYLGDVNKGGYGWVVLPEMFRDKGGALVKPRRILDSPITFPQKQRPTLATFQLIVELVAKASGQPIQFKKLKKEANMTGQATELVPVELEVREFVTLGATNETARSVIARALRQIERGNPHTQPPIPQRAWRLLYILDTGYVLDVVEVRQEVYRVDGTASGTRRVDWPSSPTAAAPTVSAPAPVQP